MHPTIRFQQIGHDDPVSVPFGVGDEKLQRWFVALVREIHLVLVAAEIEEVRVFLQPRDLDPGFDRGGGAIRDEIGGQFDVGAIAVELKDAVWGAARHGGEEKKGKACLELLHRSWLHDLATINPARELRNWANVATSDRPAPETFPGLPCQKSDGRAASRRTCGVLVARYGHARGPRQTRFAGAAGHLRRA